MYVAEPSKHLRRVQALKVPEVPMQLICMDLVGPIFPVTSRGNHFILTCIDMLTGFTIAVPIKGKTAKTVCDAYRAHVYCIFGGSARILMDNGTEFKNEQMDELCKQLNIKGSTHQCTHLKQMGDLRHGITFSRLVWLNTSMEMLLSGMKSFL